ncbi:MAG: hypothetical protein AAB834_01480, partial [Patescibacteria group bacterium]
MKKLILSMLVTLGITLLLPAAAFAAATSTVVSGIVTDKAGKPVAGATVSVICNGNTKTDTTDAAGAYGVTFTIAQCPSGKTAQAVASKGNSNGVSSGTVNAGHADINLAVVNVKIVAVPEFGVIAAIT